MFKSLFEKEWIKVKWILLAYVLLTMAAVLSIASDLHYSFKVHGAMKYWVNVITYQSIYFSILKTIPIIAGIALAFFQFLPESLNKRYRLSFHLPISENKLLLFNLLIGTLAIVLINFLMTIELYFVSSRYFPSEIVNASLLTTIPWYIAGIITYLGTSTAISEPNWMQRIVLGIMTYFSMTIFMKENIFSQYTHVLVYYSILLVLFSIIILFPGHRLRKGAK